MIAAAGEGAGEERQSRNVPLFVGKQVLHTFNEGKFKGRVISVVKGFPDFYNLVYDHNMEDTSTLQQFTPINSMMTTDIAIWKLFQMSGELAEVVVPVTLPRLQLTDFCDDVLVPVQTLQLTCDDLLLRVQRYN